MNSFGSKVKYFFGLEGDEEQDFYEGDEVVETRAPQQRSVAQEEYSAPVREYPRGGAREQARPSRPIESKLIICKYTPLDHRETLSIIDDVRAGRPVILNFQETEDFVAVKIINICEGAAYALDADIIKIASDIFIIVPQGVDVRSHLPQKPELPEEGDDAATLG